MITARPAGAALILVRIGSLGLVVALAGCASAPPEPPAAAASLPAKSTLTAAASPTAMPTESALPSRTADDGGWIVHQGAGLRRARLGGRDVTTIFGADGPPGPAHADWSPDGGRIAFQAGTDNSWDIWVANADGTGARVLVECTAPCVNLDAPAWSPDGRAIAFSRLEEHGEELPSQLQVVDVASGKVRTIVTTLSGDYVTTPRWSPDGREIVATVEDHHAPDGSLAENPVASMLALVRLTDAKPALERLTPKGLNASYPDWHPTRDLIVFQAGERIWWNDISESSSNLYTIRPDGSGLAQLTKFTAGQDALWMPAWTGDGGAILATATVRTTRANRIVMLSVDGANVHDVGLDGAHARQQHVEAAP